MNLAFVPIPSVAPAVFGLPARSAIVELAASDPMVTLKIVSPCELVVEKNTTLPSAAIVTPVGFETGVESPGPLHAAMFEE